MAIEIKGLDSLMAKLDSLGGDVLDALGKAVHQTTEVAREDAAAFSPEDTGRLRQSIDRRMEEGETAVTGTVYTNVEYAVFQEMGTYKMAAQPFMMPSLNANKSTFEQLAHREVLEAIRKAAK